MKLSVDHHSLALPDLKSIQSFYVSSKLRDYEVRWNDANPCEEINQILSKHPNNVLFIDEKVYQLYGAGIHHPQQQIFKAPALETFKSLDGVTQLYDFLYRNELNKNHTLVVVGGGIIQDIASFVACTYKRGIRWIHFPTTLLSMSDSCIGGKGGINYQNAKNQLAVFYPAFEVVIAPAFLKTLEEQDIRSGLGEILKSAIIGGNGLLDDYKRYLMGGLQSLKPLIQNALSVKKAVIEHDEFEQHTRKVLNYGHTMGHVIESLSDYQIPHGLAVVAGMMLVNHIQVSRKQLEQSIYQEVHRLCEALLDEPTRQALKKIDINDMYRVLKEDKKMQGTTLTYVMLTDIGQTHFENLALDDSLLKQTMTAYHTLFKENDSQTY